MLAVITDQPQTVGQIGCALVGGQPAEGQPVGAYLATHGLSLSELQKFIDALVNGSQVLELRGRQLWERGLPTEGTKSGGRYFLLLG